MILKSIIKIYTNKFQKLRIIFQDNEKSQAANYNYILTYRHFNLSQKEINFDFIVKIF